jgi:Sulfotransferase domain
VRGSAPHGLRFAFPSRLPEGLDLRIAIRFADSGEALSNGNAVLPAVSDAFRLAPILVTAPGRSGTTMLMERLGKCNEVVVANSHPFEIRMLSYYATAYNILTSPANLQRSTHPDKLEGTGFFVGFNPFSDAGYNAAFRAPYRREEFFSGFVPGETLSAFRNIVLEYYLQGKDDQDKKQARFFAEKNNNLDLIPRQFARTMFGRVREIVLLRDPRDLYCSRLSYFKHITPRTALQEVRWACTQLRELYQEATPDMIFVKYEDIVLGHAGELRRLSDFLGFELYSGDTSLDQKSGFLAHATSGSPASSVGRWREQMSSEEISAFDESGAEFFQLFGYESSAKAIAAGAAQPSPAGTADRPATEPRMSRPDDALPNSAPIDPAPADPDSGPQTEVATGTDRNGVTPA